MFFIHLTRLEGEWGAETTQITRPTEEVNRLFCRIAFKSLFSIEDEDTD